MSDRLSQLVISVVYTLCQFVDNYVIHSTQLLSFNEMHRFPKLDWTIVTVVLFHLLAKARCELMILAVTVLKYVYFIMRECKIKKNDIYLASDLLLYFYMYDYSAYMHFMEHWQYVNKSPRFTWWGIVGCNVVQLESFVSKEIICKSNTKNSAIFSQIEVKRFWYSKIHQAQTRTVYTLLNFTHKPMCTI